MAIRVGILGYGDLGKSVECVAKHDPDMELKVVLTRRDPDSLSILTGGAKVYRAEETLSMKDETDVMIFCGGSATDLPAQIPEMAAHLNVTDSFDTHANIPRHFKAVDKTAKESGHVGIISVGWDLGMLSLNRLYASAVLPGGGDYTFWDKGTSQGHSNTICRIKGVKDVRQYAVPVEAALTAVRSGKASEFTTRDKHTRECFVVAEEGADPKTVEEAIVIILSYFVDYDTTVHFISQEELICDYAEIPHGGFVVRIGSTGWNDENGHVIEYNLRLDSNLESTVSVIMAYARAAYCLSREGQSGCRTVFDIAPAYLSPANGAELRKHLFQSVLEKYILSIQIMESSHMGRSAGARVCFLLYIGLFFCRFITA